MKTYPFYNALTHLTETTGIVLEDDEFETIGMHAWDKIGNKNTAIYQYDGSIEDGELELPCNVDYIELITSGQEQYQSTDNVSVDNFSRLEIENYIEGYKRAGSALYARGGMPIFDHVGDKLIFRDKKLRNVHLIYKGVIVDDEGLPFLNFKEVEAIATYCAYISTNKKAMMTKDQSTFQIAQMLKQDWMRLCDNARTPIYITQNEMNDILDVKSSWDRKRHGISYKLYQ